MLSVRPREPCGKEHQVFNARLCPLWFEEGRACWACPPLQGLLAGRPNRMHAIKNASWRASQLGGPSFLGRFSYTNGWLLPPVLTNPQHRSVGHALLCVVAHWSKNSREAGEQGRSIPPDLYLQDSQGLGLARLFPDGLEDQLADIGIHCKHR